MAAEFTVRPAKRADLDAVAALYDALCMHLESTFNYPGWKLGIYPTHETAACAFSNGELYVCTDGQDILGTCILNGEQPAGYEAVPWRAGTSPEEILVVHTLATHPAHLRKGVSGMLLQFTEQYARDHGKCSIRLDVFERNIPGVQLYERHGYQVAGKTDLHLIEDDPQISRCYEKIIKKEKQYADQ